MNVTRMLTYAETENVPTWSGATTAPAMTDSLTPGMTRKTAQVRVGGWVDAGWEPNSQPSCCTAAMLNEHFLWIVLLFFF